METNQTVTEYGGGFMTGPEQAKYFNSAYIPSAEEGGTNDEATLEALVETVRRQRVPSDETNGFLAGDWVEVRSFDLRWQLAKIEKVEMRRQEKFSGEVTSVSLYFFEGKKKGLMLARDEIRAPTKGLQAVFGMRPWLWQQYALIRMESVLTFEENHYSDFESIDIVQKAAEWLNAFENMNYNEYLGISQSTKQLLRANLLIPFVAMARVRDDKHYWDYRDPAITVYTYLSTAGNSIYTVAAVLLIQIALPILLVMNTVQFGPESEGLPDRLNFDDSNESGFDTFCAGVSDLDQASIIGKLVLTIILGLYVVQIIPDTLHSFNNVSGLLDTTFSRLSNMRQNLHRERKDSLREMLGFKLDRWMNTAYLHFLYAIMVLILFLTENVLDIVLNALAIKFISEMDENIANASWWDSDFRWIKAGTMQMMLASAVDERHLKNPARLCAKYGIDLQEYRKVLGGKRMRGLNDSNQVLTTGAAPEESLEAREASHSWVDRVLFGNGMFMRYREYRAWAKWQEVLKMPEVPVDDEIAQIDYVEKLSYQRKEFDLGKSTLFFADNPIRQYRRFILLNVLSTKQLWWGLKSAVSEGTIYNRIFALIGKLLEGLIDWITCFTPIIFPISIVVAVGFFFYCY